MVSKCIADLIAEYVIPKIRKLILTVHMSCFVRLDYYACDKGENVLRYKLSSSGTLRRAAWSIQADFSKKLIASIIRAQHPTRKPSSYLSSREVEISPC